MAIKDHTPGELRYFTYYLIFPHDKDQWVDQVPFVHPLSYELPKTRFGLKTENYNDIMRSGETRWADHNGVVHRVVVEKTKRNRRWGTNITADLLGKNK